MRAVAKLHANSITHYDLKCDNVFLEFKNSSNSSKWNDSDIRVILGDFGVCKMFLNEENEFCMRDRGTEVIKSPEMLALNKMKNSEADHYDRRRKVILFITN